MLTLLEFIDYVVVNYTKFADSTYIKAHAFFKELGYKSYTRRGRYDAGDGRGPYEFIVEASAMDWGSLGNVGLHTHTHTATVKLTNFSDSTKTAGGLVALSSSLSIVGTEFVFFWWFEKRRFWYSRNINFTKLVGGFQYFDIIRTIYRIFHGILNKYEIST